MINANPIPETLRPLPSLHSASLHYMQPTPVAEASQGNVGRAFSVKQTQNSLCNVPTEIGLRILDYCQSWYSFLLVSKTCFSLVNAAIDLQIGKFLFSEEAQTLLKEDVLKNLQSIFQAIHKAIEKRETLQAKRHQEAFCTMLQGKILKQENLLLAQLIPLFLLKKAKRGYGDFLGTVKLFSAKPLPKHRYGGYPNLTVGDLVDIGLPPLNHLGNAMPRDLRITNQLGLFMVTHICSIFTQEREPDMGKFIGLIPGQVWNGIIKTYGNASSCNNDRAVDNLLASKVDAILEPGLLHWAIKNGKESLLIKLLKHNLNPDVLDEFGESALLCAMSAGHFGMVDALLLHGADASCLLNKDGDGTKDARWTIWKNRKSRTTLR